MELKCKYCTERQVGDKDCHSTCEHYLKWKEAHDKLREKVREKEMLNNISYLGNKRVRVRVNRK